MAIGFLIFGLLLISFAINLLASGAFCVTPGLRTTGNRFVINLLITNLFGCCILALTLFSNRNISATLQSSISNLDIFSPVSVVDIDRLFVLKNQMMEESVNEIIVNGSKYSETVYMCNLTYCKLLTIEKQFDTILMTQDVQNKFNNLIVDPSVQTRDYYRKVEFCPGIRYWSMDLAAALGTLSVLLVVGDTWMAVRDPLRYHCRISGVKALVFILITWIMGLLFGVTSALVEINECTVLLGIIKRYIPSGEIIELSVKPRTIVSMIFACTYFIVIILLPFGFVCRMYRRIFSEAKENGIRIRKYRSLPLLRSTSNPFNIHQQGNFNHAEQRNFICNVSTYGALNMKGDQKSSQRECPKKIAEDEKRTGQIQSTPITALLPPVKNPHIEIQINDLTRQLPTLHRFPQNLKRSHHWDGLRRIRSAPNLQVYDVDELNFLPFLKRTDTLCSDQAVLIPTIYATPKNLNCIESIRRQILNASSIFKRREESRAARISILVVMMFLISYLPYGLLVLLQGRVIRNFSTSMHLAVFLILLANLSSPFIFAFRNKRVRRGVYRIFGLDARSREHRLLRKGITLTCRNKANITVNYNCSKTFSNSIRSYTFLTKFSKIKNNIKFKTKQKTSLPNAENIMNYDTPNPTIQTSILPKKIVADDPALKIRPPREHSNCSILKICQSSPNLR